MSSYLSATTFLLARTSSVITAKDTAAEPQLTFGLIRIKRIFQLSSSELHETPTERNVITVLLWSIGWALALIASAIVLKGNPAKEWVQAVLFIGALTVSLWQGHRFSCGR